MLRYARSYAAFSLGRGVTGEQGAYLARLRHLVDVPAILVMRLLEYREHVGTLTEEESSRRSRLSKATYAARGLRQPDPRLLADLRLPRLQDRATNTR